MWPIENFENYMPKYANICQKINICQKYFTNPTKTFRPPTPTYIMYDPLSACADELLSLPKIKMIFPNSILAKGKVEPAPNLMSGYLSRSAFLTATNKQISQCKISALILWLSIWFIVNKQICYTYMIKRYCILDWTTFSKLYFYFYVMNEIDFWSILFSSWFYAFLWQPGSDKFYRYQHSL